MANREMFHNGFDPSLHQPGMSVDEANFAFGLIAQLYDESFESVGKIRALTLKLTQEPATFWEYYSFVTGGDHNRELREAAIEFISRPEFDPNNMEQLKAFGRTA